MYLAVRTHAIGRAILISAQRLHLKYIGFPGYPYLPQLVAPFASDARHEGQAQVDESFHSSNIPAALIASPCNEFFTFVHSR